MRIPRGRSVVGIALFLCVALLAGLVFAVRFADTASRQRVVAYFDNTNGLYRGDEVRIMGVAVGAIDRIEPQVDSVKVTFWIDKKYRVPAEADAVIISPQLVTSRAIQLTPAYIGGPQLRDGAVIPLERTAVPVEWDDLRRELQKLTDALRPTQPGQVSTLGAFINTAADNMRGQGANMRSAITAMAQAFSALGDHSGDMFATVRNLSLIVSALKDSSALLEQLNENLALVSGLLVNDPDEVGSALHDLNSVVADTTEFLSENREAVGTATDKLSSISVALVESLGEIKQMLHVFPNAFQNFVNIYQPAQAALTGALVLSNFANPVSFICGAIQAASRMNGEQSAKLCTQYLAPIVKNRQWNFPPIGVNPFVGATARPNERTYSEDWMRPDYVPPVSEPVATLDPQAGLRGMMVAPAGGS